MLEAHEWNVVAVGFWNPAILTPSGMAKRLFGLSEGVPVQVEVPLDGVGSPRVTSGDVTATLAGTRLIIEPKSASFAGLAHAMSVASNGIRALPETPFSAAGFNVRFKAAVLPGSLVEIIQSGADSRLSDGGFRIAQRTLSRSLVWKAGRVNLTIEHSSDGPCGVLLNFDRRSSDGRDLTAWLETPQEDIKALTEKMLDLLGLQEVAVHAGR